MVPFTMRAPWQFRLPPPPSLASEPYTRDYQELKRLGGKQSTVRTPAQAEIARFSYEGSPQGWNRIARVIVAPARARPLGARAALRPPERRHGRRIHLGCRYPLPLQLLAAGHGDPGGRL